MIAEDRAGRPSDFSSQETASGSQAECPFCAGHEQLTPEPLLEVVGADGEWQVRVIPNKYPAVMLKPSDTEHLNNSVPGSVQQPPIGTHEVFVESPLHIHDITELSVAELVLVLQAYRDRLRFWSTDVRIGHATIFKNVGVAAGASLGHIHSQLLALPGIPPVIAAELKGTQSYFVDNQACLYCRLIDEELAHRMRLVVDTGSFVAFCAFAGRQPYETWILPREHSASYENLSDADTLSLAEILLQVVERLRSQLSPLSYNLLLHTAPFSPIHADSYHWHFELVPRTTTLAGFEWGTGMYINPLAPERAAEKLRVGRASGPVGAEVDRLEACPTTPPLQ